LPPHSGRVSHLSAASQRQRWIWPMHEHDVIAGAPAMVQKHEMAGRLVAPR